MAHNLFGGSYFGAGDWRGRYFVLSSAAALLLASLFFAFRLRDRFKTEPSSGRFASVRAAIVRRPEQLLFFVPVILLTCMLSLKMRAGMITVSWGVEGLLIFLFALAVKESSFRRTGLIVLLLCIAKLAAFDFWGLQLRDQWITCVSLGAAAMFVSFLWNKYKETIRQLL
jgi:hypothetical protein